MERKCDEGCWERLPCFLSRNVTTGAFDKNALSRIVSVLMVDGERNHGTTTDTVEEYRGQIRWLCDIEAAFCSGEIPAWARV